MLSYEISLLASIELLTDAVILFVTERRLQKVKYVKKKEIANNK